MIPFFRKVINVFKLGFFGVIQSIFMSILIFKKHKMKDSIILRVGGSVHPIIETKINKSKKILDVNISDDYLGQKNMVNIKSDAHNINLLNSEYVDFVLSSHTLEHMTNTIKALNEWKRILKKNGIIYLSVPYYKKTFDWKRDVTNLEHFIDDYENNVGLNDNTHDDEFIKNYDVNKDFNFNSYEEWYKMWKSNPQIYTHYHVFDKKLLIQLMNYVGFKKINCFIFAHSIEYYGKKL
ncbi:MAG TPA: methyltransferase domain-containing protein [Spirochaetota bacterium]|nr:methyltransferase domain-containing protein [Spirochaetota bacterium]